MSHRDNRVTATPDVAESAVTARADIEEQYSTAAGELKASMLRLTRADATYNLFTAVMEGEAVPPIIKFPMQMPDGSVGTGEISLDQAAPELAAPVLSSIVAIAQSDYVAALGDVQAHSATAHRLLKSLMR